MYLHLLSVSAREIRRGSGKKRRVSRKPAALKVAVLQNLFLQQRTHSQIMVKASPVIQVLNSKQVASEKATR